MTNDWLKTRLATLSFTAVACAPALHAQAPTHSDGVIATASSGVISPEIEKVSVRPVCNGRTFSFTIVNHRFKASELVEARAGRRQSSPESTAALRQFLAGVRNVHFGSSECLSPNEIGISLHGLLRNPPPGRRDDVLRLFRIRFRE